MAVWRSYPGGSQGEVGDTLPGMEEEEQEQELWLSHKKFLRRRRGGMATSTIITKTSFHPDTRWAIYRFIFVA